VAQTNLIVQLEFVLSEPEVVRSSNTEF